MPLTNKTALPLPLVAALDDGYSRGDADISVTGLLAPPRKVALEERYAGRLTEDAADLAAILIGKAVHEKIAANAIGELDDKKRLRMMVNGWVVSGQTDNFEVVTDVGGKVRDFKTVSVSEWLYGLKVEREQQLNCYAELLRANGYTVSALSAILIFKDWSATRASYEKDYPPHSIVEVEVPLWPQQQAQDFIEERVRLHQRARVEDVLCSDEERWLRLKYAVVKGGNKRATKLFENQEEAERYVTGGGPCFKCGGDGTQLAPFTNDDGVYEPMPCSACSGSGIAAPQPQMHVEVRGGEPLRCMHYCTVGRMGLCEQWSGDGGGA